MPRAETITRPAIERLVHRFYERVRDDDVLGPVFEQHVEDWPSHLDRMCRFWASALLGEGSYRGSPPLAHAKLGVTEGHFDRWVALFRATVDELFTPTASPRLVQTAQRMRVGLSRFAAKQR